MSIEIEDTSFDEGVEVMPTETKKMDCDEYRCLIKATEDALETVEERKLNSNCCIYRVPQRIRQTNPVAYTPKVVSIGPLHHGDEKFKLMEELKLEYLKCYLKRTNMDLEDCITRLKGKEEDIRSCYEETISLESNDFVKMILIDACFIIEYFSRFIETNKSDPIISNSVWWLDLRLDLILLENQIPFFVLEDLFTSIWEYGKQYSSFLEVSFVYLLISYYSHSTFYRLRDLAPLSPFEYFLWMHLKKEDSKGDFKEVKVRHLTDMLRIFFLPSETPERAELKDPKDIAYLKYSASQLLEVGLKFEARENRSLIEVELQKGVLEMPPLLVEYDTEALFRNVAALELCHYPSQTYVAEYLFLLDFLINDRKDVDILVDKGIMVSMRGDREKVVAIFNNICMGMDVLKLSGYYNKLYSKLNGFYKKSLPKYLAIFIRDYCSTPWKILSFLAAILLLLLTSTQTICSILSLPKGK